MKAQTLIGPAGLPRAPKGMANSIPERTCAAAIDCNAPALFVIQDVPSTPFVLLSLIVAWMPNGLKPFVPPAPTASVPFVVVVEPTKYALVAKPALLVPPGHNCA